MTASDTWTIGRLLEWTTDYLKQHDIETPRLEAEVLLADARGCQRIDLYTAFTEAADEATRQSFRELVRRRAAGTPVAYLVGHKEFYSLSFKVTPDVLIPRPETELLIVALLDHIKEMRAAGERSEQGPLAVADIGTGSGILAVCAARHAPQAKVTAADIHPPALEVAKENARKHQVAEAIEFLESDLFVKVPADRKFDFVLSNPPYITTAEMQSLPADVKQYEPHLALHGGEQGTDVIARLIPQAAERLKSGGWLLMEISPMLQSAVEGLVAQEERFELRPTLKDMAGHPRVVQAKRH